MKWIAAMLSLLAFGAAARARGELVDAPGLRSRVLSPGQRVRARAGAARRRQCRGAAVAAWVDTHGRVRVAVATRPGRFGARDDARAARAASRSGDRARRDDHRGLAGGSRHAAVRPPSRPPGAFRGLRAARGARQQARRRLGQGRRRARRLRGRRLRVRRERPDGHDLELRDARSPAVTLGKGGFDHDSVRAAPDGTLAACCIQPVNDDPSVPPDTATKVAVYRSAGGWRLVSAAAVGKDEIETVFASASALVLGTTQVAAGRRRGRAGRPRARARRGGRRRRRAPARAREPPRSRPGARRDDRRLGPQRPRLPGEDQAAGVRPAPRPSSRASPPMGRPRSRPAPGSTAERPTNPRSARSAPARSPPGSSRAHAGAWRSNATAASAAPRRRAAQARRSTSARTSTTPTTSPPSGDYAVLAWVAADGSVRVGELYPSRGSVERVDGGSRHA